MRRTLADVDVSLLKYDPRKLHFLRDITKEIPEFKAYDGKIPPKLFSAFVVLMYDINSPLWREEPDYNQRMYEAARIANFPMGKKNEFSKEAEDVLFGRISTANDAIVAYITGFGLPEYLQLMGYTILLSQELRKIIGNEGGKESPKMLEETGAKMRSLQRFIFNTGNVDITKEMQHALYSRLERDKLRMRPEEIIKELASKGKLPADFSPYKQDELPNADDYLRENMTFHGDEG